MRYPTDNPYVSSGFGWRYYSGGANFHRGCDFPRPFGGKLYAILDGVVVANTYRQAGGWTVAIDFKDGTTGWYQHLYDQSDLRVGSHVDEGDVIGHMGMTGTMVTGVHLHFELWRNGAPLDPEPYLRAGTAASGGGDKPLPIPTPEPEPTPIEDEDEDMAKNSGFYYVRAKDNKRVNLIVNTSSGFWVEYLPEATVPAESNNAVASTFDTGSYAEVKENFAVSLKAALDKARTGTA